MFSLSYAAPVFFPGFLLASVCMPVSDNVSQSIYFSWIYIDGTHYLYFSLSLFMKKVFWILLLPIVAATEFC